MQTILLSCGFLGEAEGRGEGVGIEKRSVVLSFSPSAPLPPSCLDDFAALERREGVVVGCQSERHSHYVPGGAL